MPRKNQPKQLPKKKTRWENKRPEVTGWRNQSVRLSKIANVGVAWFIV